MNKGVLHAKCGPVIGPDPGPTRSERARAIIEVLSGLVLIFGYIWLIHPLRIRGLHIASVAVIGVLFLWAQHASGESWREVGFRFDNLRASSRIVLPVTFVSALALAAVWQCFFPLNLGFYKEPGFWFKLVEFPVWALLQQTIAQVFFFRRFRKIAWPYCAPAILVFGLLFSAAHIPNPPLMLFTFVAGLFWSWAYHKYTNVFAIAVSHAIVSLVCSCILLVHGSVGPSADIRWIKTRPVSYGIDTINGVVPDNHKTQTVAGNTCEKLVVVGWAKGVTSEIEAVFVEFDGKKYLAERGLERKDIEKRYSDPAYRSTGFRVEIPIKGLEPDYHVISLQIALKGKRLLHRPSKRFWVKIE